MTAQLESLNRQVVEDEERPDDEKRTARILWEKVGRMRRATGGVKRSGGGQGGSLTWCVSRGVFLSINMLLLGGGII